MKNEFHELLLALLLWIGSGHYWLMRGARLFGTIPLLFHERLCGRIRPLIAGMLLAVCLVSLTTATVPPQNTEITSIARVVYYDSQHNLIENVIASRIITTIGYLSACRLEPNRTARAVPGQPVDLAYRLVNAGNGTDTYTLTLTNTAGDFTLANPHLAVDANGNGIFDAGDTDLGVFPVSGIRLQSGEFAQLLVQGTVPAWAAKDQEANLILEAIPAGQPSGASSATGTVIASPYNIVRLTKAVSSSLAKQGDILTYTLEGVSLSSSSLTPLAVSVDTTSTIKRIVLRDQIPANTWLSTIVDRGLAQPVYHVAGEARHHYRSAMPSDSTTIDAVAFLYEAIPPEMAFKVSFAVQVGASGTQDMANTAQICTGTAPDKYWQEESMGSNTVHTLNPDSTMDIRFYTDNQFNTQANYAVPGTPLNIQVLGGSCNINPSAIEKVTLNLSTRDSFDQEFSLQATEIGANAGVFHLSGITTAAWPKNSKVSGNGIVEVGMNDVVTVISACGGNPLTAALPIRSKGMVFDSMTGQPVSGSTVTLKRGTTTMATATSEADGSYLLLPEVLPGSDYVLKVSPPKGYRFPSSRPPSSFAESRRVDASASYGNVFTVPADIPLITFGLPLDPVADDDLLTLSKKASADIANIGSTVGYTVTIENKNGTDIKGITRLVDELPTGFHYVVGTARWNGAVIPEPVKSAGNLLTFSIDGADLKKGGKDELSYRVRVGTGVKPGENWNRAQLHLPNGTLSNMAQAKVIVPQQGVFSDEAFILGKVFLDCNGDALQQDGEVGVPGVRLYLDTGDFVITDEEGKYSFYGISPRTHVLKADNTTLPVGATLGIVDNRNALDPGSRFVDLKNGELHRADFAINSCTAEVRGQIEKRRSGKPQSASELTGMEKSLLNVNALQGEQGATTGANNNAQLGRPASGLIDRGGSVESMEKLTTLPPAYSNGAATPGNVIRQGNAVPSSKPTTISFEPLMPKMAEGFGFLDLKDGDTLDSDTVSVRIKGPAKTTFRLLVNGDEVPGNRVGQKSVMESRNLQAWEYIGVRFKPGDNLLTAQVVDSFGNVREKAEIKVRAPGKPARLELLGPKEGGIADGRTPVLIKVRLSDEFGTPVTARMPVTLESTMGTWGGKDLDPKEPGLQAFMEGGEGLYELVPPLEAGKALIRVTAGSGATQEATVAFLPHLRPMVAAGVVEGVLGLSRIDHNKIDQDTSTLAFEREISMFMDEGNSQAGMRGSVFLKGRVKGDYLLTLTYDSDKETKERLFRDIRPDEFYPVYGDSSVRGFEAQSSGKLYVRVDKGRSYILYGDYNTNPPAAREMPIEEVKLGAYNRSLNGGAGKYENDRLSVSGFAAYTDSVQRVVELRAQGISGPYLLDLADYVINSETVELITRDRSQPSLVIERKTMARYSDYWIDAIAGWLTFNQPVRSVDENLNPVYIRVTYEVSSGKEKKWIYGGAADFKVFDWLKIGATYARDEHTDGSTPGMNTTAQTMGLSGKSAYELFSGHATVTIDKNSWLVAEVAQSRDIFGDDGMAERIEYLRKGDGWEARLYGSRSEAEFYNPNGTALPGRDEVGAAASYRLNDKTSLFTEAVYSAALSDTPLDTDTSSATARDRVSILLGAEHKLNDSLSLKGGLRHTEEEQTDEEGGGNQETESALARLTWRPWFLPKADGYLEYEQALGDSERRMAALGANYALGRGKFYARHEFISTLNTEVQGFSDKGNGTTLHPVVGLTGQENSRQTTSVGFEYYVLENTSTFSEYRILDAFDGQSSEMASGVKNRWDLGKDLKANASFERIQPFEGETEMATAIAGSISYSDNKNFLGVARLEWRGSESTDSWLNTLGYAYKFTPDWTGLASNTFWYNLQNEVDEVTIKNRFRVGAAYRQTKTNDWNALMYYEFKPEINDTADEDRQAHIWSFHANWHPWAKFTLSGRYAGEVVQEDTDDYQGSYLAHLVSSRLTYDLTDRFDIGFGLGTLLNDEGMDEQQMLGLEVGYLIDTNIWLSGGYNILGFHSDDLSGNDYTDQGPYIRLRIKFDENMFGWLQ